MKARWQPICAALLAGSLLAGCGKAPKVDDTPQLREQLALLEARAQRLEDINAIKRLQRSYGYYLDEGQWSDLADLFAADATLEIGKDGVYRGRERIREYFRTLGNGRDGLAPGQLNEHLQVMPVITLAEDGRSARGTWRAVILAGQLGKEAWWSEGPYENQYVKEDGVWKIAGLRWFQTLWVPYEGGWAHHADANGARFVGDRLQPDAPTTSRPGRARSRRRSISAASTRDWKRRSCRPMRPRSRPPASACSRWR
jgi:hypothetical protein